MRSFINFYRVGACAFLGLTMTAGAAQAPARKVDERIDVKNLKLSTTVQDVVVPLPGEIFTALNKLGSVNWGEHVRTDKGSNFQSRPRVSLLLGTVIADGFIAVQAQNAPAVKDIGQRVLKLAQQMGVGNSITPHAKAIIEAADKSRWENVRLELDRTQKSVQDAMNELGDQKLSQLVSLGGWLRGTEVLTSVVTKRFTPEGAELLHQPDLLAHFQTQLQQMPTNNPDFKAPIIHEIYDALGQVRPMIDVGGGKISQDSVKKINDITTKLDFGIVTRE
jgi:hypothetical protein